MRKIEDAILSSASSTLRENTPTQDAPSSTGMSDRDVPWRVQRVEPCAAVPETLQRLYTGDVENTKNTTKYLKHLYRHHELPKTP